MIGLENIIERFQLKRLYRMILISGNEDNQRFMRKLADVFRQHHPIQRRDVDIKEDDVHPVILQVFQHIEAIIKHRIHVDLAVLFDKPAQLLLCQKFIFDNDRLHVILLSPAQL